MAIVSTNYGTFITHVGTLAEVAGALKGKNIKLYTIFYNGTNITGIEIL